MHFIPISPQVDRSGALAALAPQLIGAEATPKKVDSGMTLSNFEVNTGALSIEMASRFGLGGIFSSSGDSLEQALYLDAALTSDVAEEADRPLLATRWGVGLRVCLRVRSLSASVELTIANVGAAVDLNQARAEYSIQGIGLGVEGFGIVAKGMSTFGTFDYRTYVKITEDVVPALGSYLSKSAANLKPMPMAVAVRCAIDPITPGRSVYFAMRSLQAGRTLGQAVELAAHELEPNIVTQTYVEFGIRGPREKIPKEVTRAAAAWLRV